MDDNIHYIGNYRFNDGPHRHREPYWESKVVFNDREKRVVDSAGMDDDGQCIVHLLPYEQGIECPQIDEILRDGDLLAYVLGPKRIEIPLGGIHPSPDLLEAVGEVLKGRATHAELGYRNDANQAMQVSLWEREGPMQADDRKFCTHTDSDTINIYRVSLAGYHVDARTEALLKAEVKRWKELVKPVYFPCGRSMNIDPVDFTDLDGLHKIAEGFINHQPGNRNPPFNFKLNCVQWTTLVFSLAVCFPLSEVVLRDSGFRDAYHANWAPLLGYAPEGLVGIQELPIPSYTVEEIIEDILDLYLPEQKTGLLEALTNLPLQQVLGDQGGMASKRIMPNAFLIENLLRGRGFKRKTRSVFRYIATAAPAGELESVSQPGKD